MLRRVKNIVVCWYLGFTYSWITELLSDLLETFVLSIADQSVWKGGVLSVYNHNICVYNLTITSTCYGQHVECVRPEVQMVLFNTVSTVHVVNRTRVNSRSIIIATLNTLDMLSCKTTRVWNGCSVVPTSLLNNFTPPQN